MQSVDDSIRRRPATVEAGFETRHRIFHPGRASKIDYCAQPERGNPTGGYNTCTHAVLTVPQGPGEEESDLESEVEPEPVADKGASLSQVPSKSLKGDWKKAGLVKDTVGLLGVMAGGQAVIKSCLCENC